MRFLDLDLDFFLNKNAYGGGHDGGRLGPDYKPWPASKVRRFLEDRCGLSPGVPVPGRTIESHDGVLDFWRTLIESGRLKIPFEVVHVDAHPDLLVGGGMYHTGEFLYIDPERESALLKKENVHPGSYLTFAIAWGWIGSLVWIPLLDRRKNLPAWDGDARSLSLQVEKGKDDSPLVRDSAALAKEHGMRFRIVSWSKFKTSAAFDFIALSKSPEFTPPASDALIPVIEAYLESA